MKTISKKEYEKKDVWGLLTSIDLFKCNPKILRDEKAIKKYVVRLCKLINMERYGDCIVVNFGKNPRVRGFSMTQLIESSLISGHFAEESNSVYIDIFSCKFYDQKKAVEFTKKFFEAKDVEAKVILRGRNIGKRKG